MKGAPMTGRIPLHQSALVGWRSKLGDAVAGPVSQRTPLTADQVRLALCIAFFLSAVYYVVDTVRRVVRDRSSADDA
jgi:hypothetical protein